jgi:hypothetical protein
MFIFEPEDIYRDMYDSTSKERYIKLSHKPWRDNMFLWQKVKKVGWFYKKIGRPFYLHESFIKIE